MSGWNKVRWTQARQVTRLMGIKDRDAPAEAIAPAAYCAALRDGGRLGDAVSFVGHALPRFESVAWAAAQVKAIRGQTPPPAPEMAAFNAVAAWLKQPDDTLRRAAFDASDALEDTSAEKLLGYAVWFSGGSIAPDGQAPVLPGPEVCGRFAALAVAQAAIETGGGDAALAAALAAGEAAADGAAPARAAG